MTLDEIKQAVDAGNRVHWGNAGKDRSGQGAPAAAARAAGVRD